MSLADELLADLESDNDDEFESQLNAYNNGKDLELMEIEENESSKTISPTTPSVEEYATAEELAANMDLRGKNVKELSTLMTKLLPILQRIDSVSTIDTTALTIENSPLYQLLVEANEYSVEIDSEIIVIHEFIKENYSKRFGELGSLVPNPVDYAKVVRAIGNDISNISSTAATNELKSHLNKFLPGATLMIITMSAFENKGQPLSNYELDQVFQACDLLTSLVDAKNKITHFVSSKLSLFAPNVTQIVGSHTAAQLMGFAGGLKGLSRTPSANIPALGSKRQVSIGFGHIGIRHQGFLYHSEIIQSVPSDVRKQAMRIVSGKLILASRVDLLHSSTDASQGRKWRDEVNEKLEKLVEPPENKGPKALRIPEDKPSKKRGGRRIRKYKEQFKQTELQKAQNRMVFAKEEDEIGAYDESVGLGMAGISSSSSGQIRTLTVDNKTRAKVSKGMQARLNGLNNPTSGISSSLQKLKSSSQTSGLASSLSFTPVQGIELIDPSKLKNNNNSDQQRWFKSGTFTQIKPSTGLQLPMAPPALPSKRKPSPNDPSGPDTKKQKS